MQNVPGYKRIEIVFEKDIQELKVVNDKLISLSVATLPTLLPHTQESITCKVENLLIKEYIITCKVPKNELSKVLLFDTLQNRKFAVILTDNNNRKRLYGERLFCTYNLMRCTYYQVNEGSFTDYAGFELQFKGKLTKTPPFIEKEFATQTGINYWAISNDFIIS